MELVFASDAGTPTLFPKSIKILEVWVLEYGVMTPAGSNIGGRYQKL